MRNAFIDTLNQLADDKKVLALLADNGIIVFDEYKKCHPDQCINMGIAESNLIAMAAGLSSCGFIPFVYSIVPFIALRPYEFIRNDICYQNKNVKLVGIGAGFSYSTLGPTHHGTEDVSILRSLPNMTIISPADPFETQKAAKAAYEHDGPVYLRIGTGNNPIVYKKDYKYIIGRGIILEEGNDVAIISTGSIIPEVLAASKLLKEKGISACVINMHTLKPIDEELILEAAEKTGAILTVEEHSTTGGLGSAVAEVLLEKGSNWTPFRRMGLNDTFCKGYGSLAEVRKIMGVSCKNIISTVESLLKCSS